MRLKNLSRFSGIRYGFSERKDGPMNIKDIKTGEFVPHRNRNRVEFFAREGPGVVKIFSPWLAHTNFVSKITEEDCDSVIRADGFLTNEPGVILTVTAADCPPVYFYDPVQKVIGLAHSGWKGTLANISGVMVGRMVKWFDSEPKDIVVGIGPGIRQCCFRVGRDIYAKFKEFPGAFSLCTDSGNINLAYVIADNLAGVGVRSVWWENTECTHCLEEKYFSYRRDKKKDCMVAYIGLVM